jgi:hypothetical protein
MTDSGWRLAAAAAESDHTFPNKSVFCHGHGRIPELQAGIPGRTVPVTRDSTDSEIQVRRGRGRRRRLQVIPRLTGMMASSVFFSRQSESS